MTEVDQKRAIWPPEPGFFTVVLVKGGPRVPARIVHAPMTDPHTGEALERSWYWSAFIDGKLEGEPHINPSLARGVARIWTFGDKITAEEYRAMTERKKSAAPSAPESNPRQRINLATMKPTI